MDKGKQVEGLARLIRKDVLDLCERTNTGHVGPAFSIADILASLYTEVLRGAPTDPERDRLILSKGHACSALYSVLWRNGILSQERLSTFAQNGTTLGHHPHFEPDIGLEANTGSLGHGLSIGAGLAYASAIQNSPSRIFVILSDGETNEGSVWEAAAFAAHHQLKNLCMILDANKMQALGNTKDILFPGDHAGRWRSFGWTTEEIDGHDTLELCNAFSKMGRSDGPLAIIANTIKGKGVSFMEGSLLWHYRPPKGKEYRAALKEVS